MGFFGQFSKSTEPIEPKFRVELDFSHTVALKKIQVIYTQSPHNSDSRDGHSTVQCMQHCMLMYSLYINIHTAPNEVVLHPF